MKKPIYILGSSGFAKEVYFLLKEINEYEVKGFVDVVQKENIRFAEREYEIIKEDTFLQKENPQSCLLAIGIGDPEIIKKLSGKFKSFVFPNLIHPTVVGDFQNIKLGLGNIVTAGVIFTTGIQVGNFNIFNLSATIGHDAKIGSFNVINPMVNISGGVEIGNANLIGVSATILQYKKIGNNSIVGASSLVTKDVEDSTVVMGVPAKNKKNE